MNKSKRDFLKKGILGLGAIGGITFMSKAVNALEGINFNDSSFQQSAGRVVQVVNVQDGEVNTGTTTVPSDDTIMQNTEGNEFMTLAITPRSSTNKLKIDVVINYVHTAAAHYEILGLFQDSTASALAMGMRSAVSTHRSQMVLTHFMTSGTTSSTTFKVRLGTDAAGTLIFNGHTNSTRLFGGALASSITITEIQA